MGSSGDNPSLGRLRRELDSRPRMHGYYLLRLVDLPAGWRADEESSLTCAFEALDDKQWEPLELRPTDQRWIDYEVDEATACDHVVAGLVGGSAVGHIKETFAPQDALDVWKAFRSLFLRDARFFCGVDLGDPAYVFREGAIIVDETRAGCLGVVEDD